MPVTPDLLPNEFELTALCPVGACFVQHTYAFNKDLKNLPANYRKQAKADIVKRMTEAHDKGKHKEIKNGR